VISHGSLIVGIKVRLGDQMGGNDPAPALRLALETTDELGLPLMVHVIDMAQPVSDEVAGQRRILTSRGPPVTVFARSAAGSSESPDP
jgi:predicted amidohydrolase